jgi:glycerate kinase
MSEYKKSALNTAGRVGMTCTSYGAPLEGPPLGGVSYENPLAGPSTEGLQVTNPVDPASDHHNILKILIAPSGFKESLGPELIADAIETGVRRVFKQAVVHKLPLHDGGEGFCRALVSARHGFLVGATVMGPVGLSVHSHLGFIDDGKTAVLDMAAAAGLRLVPKAMRDPAVTTTYGVGQLMLLALNYGCRKIIIGCGDSGTSDGGAGMLQALGVKLLDRSGAELPLAGGGQSLTELHRVSWNGIHPRLRKDAGE